WARSLFLQRSFCSCNGVPLEFLQRVVAGWKIEMKTLFSKREGIILAALAFVALILLPFLNTLPANHTLRVSDFTITVYGKYLCYAVLALGVNILWGYTGLLSLGQALFFSLGGYALGMHLMLLIGKLGHYKSDIPDFMV